ncbi:MAG: hypothetical protein NZM35_09825 [Chitinophagales bacterium]|nr:hypothetical protein [Chitinophagales bacterium]MDW8419578.1 hypothetical protein [Chitinophagales bacterium]
MLLKYNITQAAECFTSKSEEAPFALINTHKSANSDVVSNECSKLILLYAPHFIKIFNLFVNNLNSTASTPILFDFDEAKRAIWKTFVFKWIELTDTQIDHTRKFCECRVDEPFFGVPALPQPVNLTFKLPNEFLKC